VRRARGTAAVFNDEATVRLLHQFAERERDGELLGHFRTKCLELMTAMQPAGACYCFARLPRPGRFAINRIVSCCTTIRQ
jgi:hypothetical protein